MNIKINNLYGIRNKLEFNFENSAIIFAPNGVGKSSIAKGFNLKNTEIDEHNMENKLMGNDNLSINDVGIKNWKGTISKFDSNNMKEILSDSLGIIKGFLKWNAKKNETNILPNNIQKDFIKLYSNIKSKMTDFIEFEEVEMSIDNFDGIEKIMSIINVTSELSDKEFLEVKEKYIEYKKILKILNKSNVKDFKAIETKINESNESISKKYNKFLSTDFDIFKIIDKYNRKDVFGYKVNGKFIQISEIYNYIEAEVKKNGVSNEDFEAYHALVKANEILNKHNITKTANKQKKDLSKALKNFAQEIHNQYIVKEKKLFQQKQNKIINEYKKFCEKYNSYVDLLNQEFVNNKTLKWKIKINKIKNYYDKTSITIYEDNVERNFDNLNDYASTGQKNIIAIMLAILDSSSKDIIVLDDIMSSLDTDNINIFKSILNKIIDDKNRCFILLTHSYTLLSQLGCMSNVSFFVLENIGNECTIFKINGKSSLFIPQLLSEKANDNNKTLFYATVIKETIENYILKPKAKYNGDIKNELLMFKNDLEWLYRHFKTNNYTFKQASQHINNNYNNVIKIFDSSHMKYLIENNSEEVISSYILNFTIKPQFENLLDYISKKYVYSLQLRFIFEKEAYNKLSKNEQNQWDENKIFGIMKAKDIRKLMLKEKIDIFTNMFSHNHLNNLRWTPIIESSLHKTKIYLDVIKKN